MELLVNLAYLQHNYQEIKRVLGSSDMYSVVKVNAYGHGQSQVVQTLLDLGQRLFCVINIEEARAILSQTSEAQVLLMSPVTKRNAEELLKIGGIPFVTSEDYWAMLKSLGCKGQVVLHCNTEMNRFGVRLSQANEILEEISASKLSVHSVSTHLSCGSHVLDPLSSTYTEYESFMSFARQVTQAQRMPHVLNSSAVYAHIQKDRPVEVGSRLGLLLYGLCAGISSSNLFGLSLKPVMSCLAPFIHIEKVAKGQGVSYEKGWVAPSDTWVGVLDIGYGNGFNPPQATLSSQSLSEDGLERGEGPFVKYLGVKLPIVGQVCMNHTMVDLKNLNQAGLSVKVGEKALVFGEHEGYRLLLTDFLGGATWPYSVLTSMGGQPGKVYVD